MTARHSWGPPNRLRLKTERECSKCHLIKKTVHEPAAAFPWIEWWKDGVLIGTGKTPVCEPVLSEAATAIP